MSSAKTSSIREYKGTDAVFLAACEIAKVTPTHRQFRKWSKARGSAHANRNEAGKKVAE